MQAFARLRDVQSAMRENIARAKKNILPVGLEPTTYGS